MCSVLCRLHNFFYQTPRILWELLGTLRSRWAVDFSENCVPAVQKVRELSSRVFPLKLSPDGVHSIMSGMQVQPLDSVTPKTWVDTKIALLPSYLIPKINLCSSGSRLPPVVRSSSYLITFWRELKTFLYHSSFVNQ